MIANDGTKVMASADDALQSNLNPQEKLRDQNALVKNDECIKKKHYDRKCQIKF